MNVCVAYVCECVHVCVCMYVYGHMYDVYGPNH